MRKIICRLSGIAGILSYIMLVYQLWHLCQFGGIRSHLPVMAGAGVLFVAAAVLYFVLRHHIRNEEGGQGKKNRLMWTGIAVAVVITVYFGAKTIYSAMTYSSALAWKIDSWKSEEKVELTHDNIFDSGAEGILEDLDKALDLPEELYIVNQFQVTFDGKGTIQTLYTFLYGKDGGGSTSTYLVDYDAAAGKDMTVRKNGWADTDYNADMKLAPVFRILEKASLKGQVSEWEKEREDGIYEILYMGRRRFATEEGLKYLPGDVDGDGNDASAFYPGMSLAGGEIIGYEVSLHIPAEEDIIPVRYIMEPEYIPVSQLEKEQELQQSDEAKKSDTWTVDREDGSMRYFLNDDLGWRLSVVNAALGSRAYSLERTEDGGASWETANEDPFEGNLGVAEGLQFFDENFGFAALSGASQYYTWMYMTKDGGSTFTEVKLPMDEVARLPEHAEDYGLSLEDYTYLCMPKKDGNQLTIDVTTGAGEDEGIRFRSEDGGETWKYDGIF